MGRLVVISSQQITRPSDTTQYSAGDFVGNDASVAANNTPFLFENVVTQLGYQALIRRIKIESEGGTVVTAGSFRVPLFTAAPASAAADNAAHSFAKAHQVNCIGEMTAILALTSADGPSGWSITPNLPIGFKSVSSKNLWGFLIAVSTYTPASGEKFTLKLEVERGF